MQAYTHMHTQCTHMYAYKYKHMHACKHTCIHTDICIETCIHAHMHRHTYTHMYTYMHVCKHTCTPSCIHACTHIYVLKIYDAYAYSADHALTCTRTSNSAHCQHSYLQTNIDIHIFQLHGNASSSSSRRQPANVTLLFDQQPRVLPLQV